jgi:hypothetical protein
MRRLAVLLAMAVCLPAAIATGGASAAGCPNEAFRVGPSALLPGCRAYEMVSPVEKNGSNVTPVINLHAAPNGEAAAYYSTAAFAGAVASPLGTAYLGRRGADWATEPLDAPQYNSKGLAILASPANSRDLTRTFQASKLALTPGATEGGSNLYLRDNTTGARTLIATEAGSNLFSQVGGVAVGAYVGGTPNWSNFILRLEGEVLPGAPTQYEGISTENLYEYEAGANPPLRLANILPNGEIAPTGGHIGGSAPYSHAISEDGRRVFFEASRFGAGDLYVREDGSRTVPVSVSEMPGSEGEVLEANFQAGSADGSVAYFTSVLEMTPGAPASSLYRWEAPTSAGGTGTLTDLTPEFGPGGPGVTKVLAASSDGSYVYFVANGALTEGSTESGTEAVNMYAWHDGETRLIAQTEAANNETFGPAQAEASPNGRYFAFNSFSRLTADALPSAACPAEPAFGNGDGNCREAYLYEWGGRAPSCLTCGGLAPRGWSSLGGQENYEKGIGDEYPHAVLDDGTVFVDTPNALVPRDSNGVEDVYAWHPGAGPELISTGTSEALSGFGDATADASNIFFFTGQSLVKSDTDSNVDVYDDREGGGIASQWPAGAPGGCDGEGCRGASPSAPDGLPQGSTVSRGNVCQGPVGAAAKASRQATNLKRKAKGAAHRKGAAAKRGAKRLRRQARAASKKANRLKRKADSCRRVNR